MVGLMMRPPAAIDHGDHVCGLFDSEAEQRRAITTFVSVGLMAGDRVMCVCERDAQQSFVRYLDTSGADASMALKTGQLILTPGADVYLSGGTFDPDLTVSFLYQAIDEALADGYGGFRATGDPYLALKEIADVSLIEEYEQMVDKVYVSRPAAGLCQYTRFHSRDEASYLARETHSLFLSRPTWEDGTLSVTPLAHRVGLRLDGEVDRFNGEKVRDVIAELAKGRGEGVTEIHLELAGLRFIDIASASGLASLAHALGNLRLVLHHPPESLSRLVELFWPESYAIELCPS